MKKNHSDSVEIAKVVLMAILILSGYFVPGRVGPYIAPLLCFAGNGFFFFSGFFVLSKVEEDDSRLKRSIKRLAIAFAVSAVVYFAIVCLELINEGVSPLQLFTKREIFNFFVLNSWSPAIGFNIYFLQSALYASVICYFANKLKLMKFDLFVMAVLFILATIFGEGAGLINFNVFGYTCITGNFLTRALPYMLLGRVIRRYWTKPSFKRIKNWAWAVAFVAGLMLAFLEIVGLAYYKKAVYLNHLLGFIPMTVAVCVLALRNRHHYSVGKYCKDMYTAMFYSYTIIAEAFYYVSVVWVQEISFLVPYLAFITLGLTLIFSGLYTYLKNIKSIRAARKDKKVENEAEIHV